MKHARFILILIALAVIEVLANALVEKQLGVPAVDWTVIGLALGFVAMSLDKREPTI